MFLAMLSFILLNSAPAHSVDLAKRTENEWICKHCGKPAEGHYCARCGHPYEKPKTAPKSSATQ